MFKAPIKVLHPLLTATQEGNFKGTEGFGAIPFDGVVLAHSNESEWKAFRNNKNNEAFLDRIYIVKVPYCLRVSEEVKIYEKLLKSSSLAGATCAPGTLKMMAQFAVLTRLKEPETSSLFSKMQVYDGENLKDIDPKAKSLQEYRDFAGVDEGMTGLSTRFAYKILSSVFNYDQTEVAANPVHLMYVLEQQIEREQFPGETEQKYTAFIKELLAPRYAEFIGKEIQTAYLESYSEYGQNIFDRYVTYADYWIQDQEYRDVDTGEVFDRAALNAELEKIRALDGGPASHGFRTITLPILFKHIRVPARNVTVMDFENRAEKLRKWTSKGVRFVRGRITEENMGSVLARHLGPGDLLIDLAWNIDACEILDWCHRHGVLYINTSTELWDPYAGGPKQHPTEKTLYWRHMNVRRMMAKWKGPGATAVIEHGANPGLISHFTKQGLLDIAAAALAEKKFKAKKAEKVAEFARTHAWNHLSRELGVKVIHCSERDTQISDKPKLVDEFVNTWSIEGFREEGQTTAEMGWGTHEKWLPPFAHKHKEGPKNQICLAQMGINVWVRSFVPDNWTILGMVVRHGEAFTISDKLTVWKKGKAVYRPTMHYAYCPCDEAISSLNEMRGYNYKLNENQRIMNDEITSGADVLGALIMGHDYNSWWVGSDLSIEESRRLVPHQNATTMQVAISVVAALLWMVENPERGVVVPDELPHEYILGISKPYLGTFISTPSDWTPLKHYTSPFPGYTKPDFDRKDPWQFKNFLMKDGE